MTWKRWLHCYYRLLKGRGLYHHYPQLEVVPKTLQLKQRKSWLGAFESHKLWWLEAYELLRLGVLIFDDRELLFLTTWRYLTLMIWESYFWCLWILDLWGFRSLICEYLWVFNFDDLGILNFENFGVYNIDNVVVLNFDGFGVLIFEDLEALFLMN